MIQMSRMFNDLAKFYKIKFEKLFDTSHDELIELTIEDALALQSIKGLDWKSLMIRLMACLSEEIE